MENLEILESEIRRKISLIKDHLGKLESVDNKIVQDIPKYLESISILERENENLKADCEKIGEQHSQDLKQINILVNNLSKLVEVDNA